MLLHKGGSTTADVTRELVISFDLGAVALGCARLTDSLSAVRSLWWVPVVVRDWGAPFNAWSKIGSGRAPPSVQDAYS